MELPNVYNYQQFLKKSLTPKFRYKKCIKGGVDVDYYPVERDGEEPVPIIVVSDTAGNALAVCSYEVSKMINQGLRINIQDIVFLEKRPFDKERQYYDTEMCFYRYQDPIVVL